MNRTAIKNPIIRGSFVLMLGGILTKFLGFYLKIYLSGAIGAAEIGRFQMTMLVHTVCAAICISAFQTISSRFVAEAVGRRNEREGHIILWLCFLPSLVLSLVIGAAVFAASDVLAVVLFSDEAFSRLLKLLAISLPFASIHTSFGGYYLGHQKAVIPAVSQLIEEAFHVISVMMICTWQKNANLHPDASLALYGVIAGECASSLFVVLCYFAGFLSHKEKHADICTPISCRSILNRIFKMYLPLTGNRFVSGLLVSLEMILIPACLCQYGLSKEESLSVFGIFSGMTLPFLFFPTTVTSSVAVMLLPAVSRLCAKGEQNRLVGQIRTTCLFTFCFGFFCTALFTVTGQMLGEFFFQQSLAGTYLCQAAILCPFLASTITLASVMNGLGKTSQLFYHNIIATLIRVLCILVLAPRIGIYGYIIGMFLASVLTTILHFSVIKKEIPIHPDWMDWIIKPYLIVILTVGIVRFVMHVLPVTAMHPLAQLVLSGVFLTVIYAYLTGTLLLRLNISELYKHLCR